MTTTPSAPSEPTATARDAHASGLVIRSRLHELLDEGARGPVTLVSAPPGSGKTTLVRSWLAARPTPTASPGSTSAATRPTRRTSGARCWTRSATRAWSAPTRRWRRWSRRRTPSTGRAGRPPAGGPPAPRTSRSCWSWTTCSTSAPRSWSPSLENLAGRRRRRRCTSSCSPAATRSSVCTGCAWPASSPRSARRTSSSPPTRPGSSSREPASASARTSSPASTSARRAGPRAPAGRDVAVAAPVARTVRGRVRGQRAHRRRLPARRGPGCGSPPRCATCCCAPASSNGSTASSPTC